MNRLELIEQLKQGKALHYDIDNVELLNVVIKEAFPKITFLIEDNYKYFYGENLSMDGYEFALTMTDENTRESIPISSFIDQEGHNDTDTSHLLFQNKTIMKVVPNDSKMIDIDKVIEWVEQNSENVETQVGHNIIYVHVNELLTFINTHTNV